MSLKDKAKHREYMKEWHKKNKDLQRLYIKEYQKRNKENLKIYTQEYRDKNPWLVSYMSAEQRCNNPICHNYKYYGGRGIKFLLTKEEMKILWVRDRAYELEWPTIDRIDNNGNYEFSNCRFIEMGENSRKKGK